MPFYSVKGKPKHKLRASTKDIDYSIVIFYGEWRPQNGKPGVQNFIEKRYGLSSGKGYEEEAKAVSYFFEQNPDIKVARIYDISEGKYVKSFQNPKFTQSSNITSNLPTMEHFLSLIDKNNDEDFLISELKKHTGVHCLKDKNGRGILHRAAAHGFVKVIGHLLSLEPNKNIIDDADEEGLTALHYACGNGQYEAVKFLIDCRANCECRTKEGLVPIEYLPIKLAATSTRANAEQIAIKAKQISELFPFVKTSSLKLYFSQQIKDGKQELELKQNELLISQVKFLDESFSYLADTELKEKYPDCYDLDEFDRPVLKKGFHRRHIIPAVAIKENFMREILNLSYEKAVQVFKKEEDTTYFTTLKAAEILDEIYLHIQVDPKNLRVGRKEENLMKAWLSEQLWLSEKSMRDKNQKIIENKQYNFAFIIPKAHFKSVIQAKKIAYLVLDDRLVIDNEEKYKLAYQYATYDENDDISKPEQQPEAPLFTQLPFIPHEKTIENVEKGSDNSVSVSTSNSPSSSNRLQFSSPFNVLATGRKEKTPPKASTNDGSSVVNKKPKTPPISPEQKSTKSSPLFFSSPVHATSSCKQLISTGNKQLTESEGMQIVLIIFSDIERAKKLQQHLKEYKAAFNSDTSEEPYEITIITPSSSNANQTYSIALREQEYEDIMGAGSFAELFASEKTTNYTVKTPSPRS